MTTADCRVCGSEMSPLRYACERCVHATRRRLDELQEHVVVLTTTLTPAGRALDPSPRSPGYGSRPPVSLDVLAALDYRSHADGTGPDDDPEESTLSVLGSLHRIALYVSDRRYRDELTDWLVPRPLTVTTLARWLRLHTEWCAHQQWAASYVDVVRALHAQLRRQARDVPERSLGVCISPGCGGTVWPDRDGDGGRCATDPQHVYTGLHLARLAYPQENTA